MSKREFHDTPDEPKSQIEMAIDWAETEGWNPGKHDAECFYAAGPEWLSSRTVR